MTTQNPETHTVQGSVIPPCNDASNTIQNASDAAITKPGCEPEVPDTSRPDGSVLPVEGHRGKRPCEAGSTQETGNPRPYGGEHVRPAETVTSLRNLLFKVSAQPASRFVSGAAFDLWGEAEALLFEAVHRMDVALEMPAVSEWDAWIDSVHAGQDADVDFDDDLLREAAAFAPREAA